MNTPSDLETLEKEVREERRKLYGDARANWRRFFVCLAASGILYILDRSDIMPGIWKGVLGFSSMFVLKNFLLTNRHHKLDQKERELLRLKLAKSREI